jgi:hypothetical protein
MLRRLICLAVLVAACTGAPSSPTPAASAGSSSIPTAGTSGQPTPARTAAPPHTPGQSAAPADLHLGGTINWSTESTVIIQRVDLPPWESHATITGTMQVVLLVQDTGYHYELSAERDGGSMYTYDYSHHETEGTQCDSHETGTLETYGGVPEGFLGDFSIGQLNVSSGLFDDLDLGISIEDWCGAQMGMDVPEEQQNSFFIGFPACPLDEDYLTAAFDGSSSYVVDCSDQYDHSSSGDTDTGTVQVTGTLQMLDGPHPTPR